MTQDNNANACICIPKMWGFLNLEFTAVSLKIKYGLVNGSYDHEAHYFHHLIFKQGWSAKENEGQGLLENQNTGRLQQNSESRLIQYAALQLSFGAD